MNASPAALERFRRVWSCLAGQNLLGQASGEYQDRPCPKRISGWPAYRPPRGKFKPQLQVGGEANEPINYGGELADRIAQKRRANSTR
jgi:hypothetical protein